jgi:hypothetical protein
VGQQRIVHRLAMAAQRGHRPFQVDRVPQHDGRRRRNPGGACLISYAKATCWWVWTLDRLSRSLKELLSLLEKVQLARAGFLSLTEAVQTTTAAGRMMGAFAEFERAMLRERMCNGLLAARLLAKVRLGSQAQRTIFSVFCDGPGGIGSRDPDPETLTGMHSHERQKVLLNPQGLLYRQTSLLGEHRPLPNRFGHLAQH